MDENALAVEAHLRAYFAGHEIRETDYDLGDGSRGTVPQLRLLEIGPGPRMPAWTYATVGCWAMNVKPGGHGLEFVMHAPVRDPRFADVLAMIAHYHESSEVELDLWHSLALGEPWTPGSTCEYILISLPYLHGPELEECRVPDGHARVLWLLPITEAEIAFRRERGTDALEQRFEDAQVNYLDPRRPSVV
jgi:hypothetical protein